MNNLDWNQLRAFYATAAKGSLSAAARELGLTQPTLSRQIAALEAGLGVTLFERLGKRLVLTETGHDLLEHVRVMGEAAAATSLSATGRSEAVEGRVSISASDAYAAYILPDIVARIRREAPQVTVVIVASNKLSDLRRREADIALRHVQPGEPDLIGKLVRTSEARFYASHDWVRQNGHPQKPADLADCLIGFEDTERFATFMRAEGVPVESDDFRLVSENSVVVWELVRRGLGVAAMLREIGVRTPDVVELLPDRPLMEVPLWLVTHRELRTNRRIRLVFDILAEELGRL